MDALPEFSDIEAARARIAAHAVRTPLVENAELNARAGRRVLLKLESLQRTGSFQFRGACNLVGELAAAEPGRPVVAYSSGNHAQGVAAAAALCGLAATIVMPADAPAIKRERTARHGATIVPYDRLSEDREAIARRIAAEQRAAIVPPYDHRLIIAGQGTAGLELVEDAETFGVELSQVLVPTSGGGLAAGIALALAESAPEARLYTVEPAGFDDLARSLQSGRRERNKAAGGSICDALMSQTPGEMTFEINRRRLAGGLVVGDEEVCAAMRFAFQELKLVLEPSGAVGLAALLTGKVPDESGALAVVLTSGNVEPGLFAAILAGEGSS
ncbi:MAG TPA: threonine/serine dehydratase [Hyphomicrobiales bacterium]|nr:threonine/serine dehydratase [Hyphomicrobiales bacterium]